MSQTHQHTNTPTLLLGTAMWGWTTSKQTAFTLLDEWYALGFREVDTATNYPIDKDPAHFRLAERILQEWIGANSITDLQVMMKIGSVNNLKTPEHILTKSFVLMLLDEYSYLFGSNLGTLMIHWDNRKNEADIRQTFEAFQVVEKQGIGLGLSGIRHPEIHAKINEDFGFDFRIQMKHNLLHQRLWPLCTFPRQTSFYRLRYQCGRAKIEPRSIFHQQLPASPWGRYFQRTDCGGKSAKHHPRLECEQRIATRKLQPNRYDLRIPPTRHAGYPTRPFEVGTVAVECGFLWNVEGGRIPKNIQ